MNQELEKRVESLEAEIYYLRKQRKIQFILVVTLICIMPIFSASIMNGDFGVGIATPSARMHVHNTTTSASFRVDDVASDTTPFLIDQSGNIGIATASPATALHMPTGRALFGASSGAYTSPITVNSSGSDDVFRGRINNATTFLMRNDGSLLMGPSSTYFAASGRENLRIIRGRVTSAGNITSGTQFSIAKGAAGQYTVQYSTAFGNQPSVTVSAQLGNGGYDCNLLSSSSATQAVVRCWNGTVATDMDFNFIAIGVRN